MIETLAHYFSRAIVVIVPLIIVYHGLSLLIKRLPRLPSGSKHKHIYWEAPHGTNSTNMQDLTAYRPGNPVYHQINRGPLSEDRYK